MELEDDLTGDVDFDFFDSPGKGHLSKSPKPVVSVESKQSPPLAPLFLIKESTKHDDQHVVDESKDVCIDTAATNETQTSSPLPVHQSLSDSLSESDRSKDYSDTFSDVSSVGSKKSSSSSRSCSSSGTRSRSSSRESISSRSSGNSSNSSVSRECSPSQRQFKSKGKRLNNYSKGSVSFSISDGLKCIPGNKMSQRPGTVHHKSRKQIDGDKKQAWESKPAQSEQLDGEFTEDRKIPLYSDNRNSDASSRSGSSSRSDSDMTDVSPLTSPRNSPKKKLNVQYRQIPLDDREEYEESGMHGNEDLDLSILMKALCDHENKKQEIANGRRVMFAPSKHTDRHNYTYTNDRATVIDRENQRLLNQIMRTVNPKQQNKFSSKNIRTNVFSPPRRLTSSAINRKKEQQRIEMENLAMLQRLHKITPSKGMKRGDQIKEFEKVTLYGVPISTVEKRKRVPQGLSSASASGLSQRSRSMSSVHSASTTASRRSTASSSKLKTWVDPRPQWCEKW